MEDLIAQGRQRDHKGSIYVWLDRHEVLLSAGELVPAPVCTKQQQQQHEESHQWQSLQSGSTNPCLVMLHNPNSLSYTTTIACKLPDVGKEDLAAAYSHEKSVYAGVAALLLHSADYCIVAALGDGERLGTEVSLGPASTAVQQQQQQSVHDTLISNEAGTWAAGRFGMHSHCWHTFCTCTSQLIG